MLASNPLEGNNKLNPWSLPVSLHMPEDKNRESDVFQRVEYEFVCWLFVEPMVLIRLLCGFKHTCSFFFWKKSVAWFITCSWKETQQGFRTAHTLTILTQMSPPRHDCSLPRQAPHISRLPPSALPVGLRSDVARYEPSTPNYWHFIDGAVFFLYDSESIINITMKSFSIKCFCSDVWN